MSLIDYTFFEYVTLIDFMSPLMKLSKYLDVNLEINVPWHCNMRHCILSYPFLFASFVLSVCVLSCCFLWSVCILYGFPQNIINNKNNTVKSNPLIKKTTATNHWYIMQHSIENCHVQKFLCYQNELRVPTASNANWEAVGQLQAELTQLSVYMHCLYSELFS